MNKTHNPLWVPLTSYFSQDLGWALSELSFYRRWHHSGHKETEGMTKANRAVTSGAHYLLGPLGIIQEVSRIVSLKNGKEHISPAAPVSRWLRVVLHFHTTLACHESDIWPGLRTRKSGMMCSDQECRSPREGKEETGRNLYNKAKRSEKKYRLHTKGPDIHAYNHIYVLQ